MKTEHKPYLITGHPRSGTGYMAAMAQACGLDIGHERMGEDGIASWMFAARSWMVPFSQDGWRGRNHYTFDRVIVVYRNPLDLIASVAFTENADRESLFFREIFAPITPQGDPVLVACESIAGWYDLIRRNEPRAKWVAVENDEAIMRVFGAREINERPPKNINARAHPSLTWDEVCARVGEDVFARFCGPKGLLLAPACGGIR